MEGNKVPDHNTISRFRNKRLEPVLDDLFNQLICKLNEMKELDFQNVFIDGTKIEANANKYIFVWEKSVSKNGFKLDEKVKVLIEKVNKKFNCTLSNMNSEFRILVRMNRSIQVEGYFVVIEENYKFRRFLTRGKKNVKVEFTIVAFAYNLKKLYNKIQHDRLGVSF